MAKPRNSYLLNTLTCSATMLIAWKLLAGERIKRGSCSKMARRGNQETLRQRCWQPGPGGCVVQVGRGGTGDALQYGCCNWERIATLPDEANSWPVLCSSSVPGVACSIPLDEPNQLLVCATVCPSHLNWSNLIDFSCSKLKAFLILFLQY